MPRWLIVPIVLVVLVLADGLAWRAAITHLHTQLQTLTDEMRAQGWTVHYRPPEDGGWPFTAALTLPDVQLSGGASALPGGLSWTTQSLGLSISLFDPWRLAIVSDGEETLQISHLPMVAFSAEQLAAALPVGHGRPTHASLDADMVGGGLQASHRRRDVSLDHLSVNLATSPAAHGLSATVGFDAGGVGLPDTGRWPLGGTVTHFSARLTLTSPPVSGADPRAQAQSWHDGAGAVRVQALDLRWGPLTLLGDADLALDPRLQPAGHAHVEAQGYAEALDALAQAHVIGPGIATTYKAILGLMVQTNVLNVPLTLRDNTLSVGAIPLARFRDILWK